MSTAINMASAELMDIKISNQFIESQALSGFQQIQPSSITYTTTPAGIQIELRYREGAFTSGEIAGLEQERVLYESKGCRVVVESMNASVNCHSYAWYKASLSTDCFMANAEALKYMKDTSYTSQGSPIPGDKIYYPAPNDHSGTVVQDSIIGAPCIESKWGKSYVYRHTPTLCPYYKSTYGYSYWRRNPIHPGSIAVTEYCSRNICELSINKRARRYYKQEVIMKRIQLLPTVLVLCLCLCFISACGNNYGHYVATPEANASIMPIFSSSPDVTPARTPRPEPTAWTPPPSAVPVTLPRNETLNIFTNHFIYPYRFNGEWNFSDEAYRYNNPLSTKERWFAIKYPVTDSCHLIYEPLYAFNMLDGEAYGVLAQSSKWVDERTLWVYIYPQARWNDSAYLTAEDVVYSFEFSRQHDMLWSGIWDTLESVEAKSRYAIELRMKPEVANKQLMMKILCNQHIIPKHIFSALEREYKGDLNGIISDMNEYPVGSGPYMVFSSEWDRTVLARDDRYWGIANTQLTGGVIPAPKYINITYYDLSKNANAGSSSEPILGSDVYSSVDVIHDIYNEAKYEELYPGRSYLMTQADENEPNLYLPSKLFLLGINANTPGLDSPAVRKALAMCFDYDTLGSWLPRVAGVTAFASPAIGYERGMIDTEQNDTLRWKFDIDNANSLLDSIGAKRGEDGIRVLNGERLGPWRVIPCSYIQSGTLDDSIIESAEKIGIEIYIEPFNANGYVEQCKRGDFELIIYPQYGFNMDEMNPNSLWERLRDMMYSKGVPEIGQEADWNWHRYANERADELIEAIPNETDPDAARAMYTELERLFLEDAPAIPLAYDYEYCAYIENYWTGFPQKGDELNIPPTSDLTQWGIKALYHIRPVE